MEKKMKIFISIVVTIFFANVAFSLPDSGEALIENATKKLLNDIYMKDYKSILGFIPDEGLYTEHRYWTKKELVDSISIEGTELNNDLFETRDKDRKALCKKYGNVGVSPYLFYATYGTEFIMEITKSNQNEYAVVIKGSDEISKLMGCKYLLEKQYFKIIKGKVFVTTYFFAEYN